MSANPLEELARLARERSRRLFVAEMPIDLTTVGGSNCVFVLELPGSAPGAAGGRVGGIGERRIEKAYCFRQVDGSWVKVYETEVLEKLERFELPYHAAGMSIVLPDGSERVVSGVVDQELIQRYNEVV